MMKNLHSSHGNNGVTNNGAGWNDKLSNWIDDSLSQSGSNGIAVSSIPPRHYEQHEHVFLDGEAQTHIYQVISGAVGIYKLLPDGRRQIISFNYPGDLIGLDHPEHFGFHGEALCATTVRAIPISVIDAYIANDPEFGMAMLRQISTELAEARDQVLSLGRKSALEKLATFLMRIVHRNEDNHKDPMSIYLPMSRADIADYLGLTIETVSRNITRLKVAHVIRLVSTSEITVLDYNALKSIANATNVGSRKSDITPMMKNPLEASVVPDKS